MTTSVVDRFAAAGAVADAVLYEGYVLYPYRASSTKNQFRWQFGVLAPKAFCEADGSERWAASTECLLDAGPLGIVWVRIRCLQIQRRLIERAEEGEAGAPANFVPTASLEVDGAMQMAWEEAVEQAVELPPLRLSRLAGGGHIEPFALRAGSEYELVRRSQGSVAGRVVHRRQPVTGRVIVTAAPVGGRYVRVGVRVENTTTAPLAGTRRREAMEHSLAAVHFMMAVDDGCFVSLLDPPDAAREAAAACRQDGSYPVLIGDDKVVLSSPIILYDHPEIALESPGDLFDATEIDEILALRVLTLTDAEKCEARGTDPRAAAIIDRCDTMGPDQWDRLHGTIRVLRPAAPVADDARVLLGAPAETIPAVPWWDPAEDQSVDPWSDSVMINGVQVHKGTRVVLRPSHRADAQDLFLAGLSATVAGVFSDVDGDQHLAVTIDGDPAATELVWQGRYLFFHLDEVEPLVQGPGR